MAVNFNAEDTKTKNHEEEYRNHGAREFNEKIGDLESPFEIKNISKSSGFGFSNIFSGVSDTKTATFVETILEIFKNLKVTSEIKTSVFPIPSENIWLSHFAIVFTRGSEAYAATFGIEGSNQVEIPDQVVRENERVVSRLKRYAHGIYTKKNMKTISQLISEEMGEEVTLINTSVISKEIDPKNRNQVTNLIHGAVTKILTRFASGDALNGLLKKLTESLNESDEKRRTRGKLLLTIDSVNNSIYDYNLRPIAADIKFSFVLENSNSGSGEPIDATSTSINLGNIYGIWSFIPTTRRDSKDNPNQCLIANLTITHVEGQVVVDPGWTSMLLAQVTSILQKYEFLRYIIPNPSLVEKLGAMNIYVNEENSTTFGQVVELDPYAVEDNMLMVRDWFYPNASVSMCYDPMNPTSVSILRVFEASGNDDRKATNSICAAVESLFDLEQQSIPEPFLKDEGSVYFGGRYTTTERGKEDNIIHLFNPQNLFYSFRNDPKTAYDLVVDLVKDGGLIDGVIGRQQLITGLTHNTGVPDSIVSEFSFNPEFLDEIVKCLLDIGIEPEVITSAPRLIRGRNSLDNSRNTYDGRTSGRYSRNRRRDDRYNSDYGYY